MEGVVMQRKTKMTSQYNTDNNDNQCIIHTHTQGSAQDLSSGGHTHKKRKLRSIELGT